MSRSRARRPRRVELVHVGGGATAEELEVIAEAIERIAETERQSRLPSLWLRAGRGQGRRLGMYDYRDRFSHEEAWRLSLRFPTGGREYSGLYGRGDAK